jgi:putative DNA primase/helicase
MLPAALAFAAAGLPVFPCHPRTKEPATRRGFYDATTNPACIRRYWNCTDYNIAIPTGAHSGIWIVDIDPGGEDHLLRLEATHGALPETRAVRTGRGGFHLWFKYVGPIPLSRSRVAPHVDVQGDGGYAVVPPSVHPNGRRYTWHSFSGAAIAVAPGWIVELTRKRPTISERASVTAPRSLCATSGAYGAAALNNEAAAVAAALPGTRNHALNRAAFCLFQLVGGGELNADTVENRLIRACEINGLIHDDGLPSVVATIASGKRGGLQYPRSRSGRVR